MSKDPAFLFYSSDFLSGVADLTMDERGQYITLLCVQHQKGFLSDKTIRLSVGLVSVDVLAKFIKDNNGNYFNERLYVESEKRNKFTESRINNGKKGGRPKKNEKPIGLPKQHHMENEDANEIDNKNSNKIEEFDFSEIVNIFHSVCINCPKVSKITDSRKSSISARVKEHGLEVLGDVFKKVSDSDYLCGKVNGWIASFDWILTPANFIKILEDNYKNKKNGEPKSNSEIAVGVANSQAARDFVASRTTNKG